MRTAAALLLFLALPAFAADPNVEDAKLARVSAGGDLTTQIRSVADGWVGYAIPLATPRSVICDTGNSLNISGKGRTSSTLELFFRMREGRVESIRAASSCCVLDADGARVVWIEDVAERDAIAFLIDLARHHDRSSVRARSMFWLGMQAGDRAVATLRDAVHDDPEADVRAKAVFGIAMLPDDRSIPMLAQLMRNNRTREVRKKAAFWLGQKDDPRALAALEAVLVE